MSDSIVYALATVLVVWGLWLIGDYVRLKLKHRRINKQIAAGIVPVDYKEVARVVQELNSSESVKREALELEGLNPPKIRKRLGDLKRIRTRVAYIRDAGYCVGERQRHQKDPIEVGLRENPFEKGTGESKQWVRGYCMGFSSPGNIVHPGEWMKRA